MIINVILLLLLLFQRLVSYYGNTYFAKHELKKYILYSNYETEIYHMHILEMLSPINLLNNLGTTLSFICIVAKYQYCKGI